MARITVEDCLKKIPNRFQLVLAATYRARMLSQGHAPRIETKNKPGCSAGGPCMAFAGSGPPQAGGGAGGTDRRRRFQYLLLDHVWPGAS